MPKQIVYQIWYETSVGSIHTTKQGAIDAINASRAKYGDDPYDPNDDYPDIREFEVDTGFIKGKRTDYDR